MVYRCINCPTFLPKVKRFCTDIDYCVLILWMVGMKAFKHEKIDSDAMF